MAEVRWGCDLYIIDRSLKSDFIDLKFRSFSQKLKHISFYLNLIDIFFPLPYDHSIFLILTLFLSIVPLCLSFKFLKIVFFSFHCFTFFWRFQAFQFFFVPFLSFIFTKLQFFKLF